MAFELPPASVRAGCARTPHECRDAGVPLRKAPQDLRRQAERCGQGHPRRERLARGHHQKADGPLFNNAAQTWNHTFFWNGLSPDGGGAPSGAAAEKIDAAFGSYDDFRTKLTEAATTQFGSGWAWLVDNGGTLEVMKTANADLPMKHGATALWTIDVWEHAYYIDYRNARPKFIDAVLDNLINWEFVNQNLAS